MMLANRIAPSQNRRGLGPIIPLRYHIGMPPKREVPQRFIRRQQLQMHHPAALLATEWQSSRCRPAKSVGSLADVHRGGRNRFVNNDPSREAYPHQQFRTLLCEVRLVYSRDCERNAERRQGSTAHATPACTLTCVKIRSSVGAPCCRHQGNYYEHSVPQLLRFNHSLASACNGKLLHFTPVLPGQDSVLLLYHLILAPKFQSACETKIWCILRSDGWLQR